MSLKQLMDTLSREIGLDTDWESEDGFYVLTFDGDVQIRLAESTDTGEIVVLCEVMQLPEAEAAVEVMRTLLGANYRWGLTARGQYGVHPQTGVVEYASREKLADLDDVRFQAWLQSVVAVISTIKREVRNGVFEAAQQPGSSLNQTPSGALAA